MPLSTVISTAQAEIANLQTINAGIDAEVNAIVASAQPGVGLTAEALARVQDLQQKQSIVLRNIQELALVSAAALDNSDTLKHITASLKTSVQGLKNAAAGIAAVSATCAQITAVCGGIDGVIAQLTSLIGTAKS